MKTSINNLILVKSLLLAVLTSLTLVAFSQPEYTFRNPSRISGTQNQVNSKYRFSRVKTGVDAIVTITAIDKIELTDLDGSDGYDEAFQPVITVPRKTEGYVEFKIEFVNTGTSTLRVMPEVPLTAIDIDGNTADDKIYEFDEFKTSPTYRIDYDFLGTNLDVRIAGTMVRTINTTAVDYPGIDTVKKDVMFSMIHAGVSTVTLRVGANNKSRNEVERLRSIYFKKFNYGVISILAQSQLKSFIGKQDKSGVSLNWEFTSTVGISQYILERSVNAQDFTEITSKSVNENSGYVHSYYDATAGNNKVSYRLKVVATNGKVSYSQVIVFRSDLTEGSGRLVVFPTLIQNSTASVQVTSEIATKSMIQVVDYSGKVIYHTPVHVAKGNNSFSLDLAGKAASGNYVVVMQVEGKILTQKIVIR
jgi:hypothetical protein